MSETPMAAEREEARSERERVYRTGEDVSRAHPHDCRCRRCALDESGGER